MEYNLVRMATIYKQTFCAAPFPGVHFMDIVDRYIHISLSHIDYTGFSDGYYNYK